MSDNLVKRLQENGDLLRHVEAQAARIAKLEAALATARREGIKEAAQSLIEKYQSMVIRPNTPEAWRFSILHDLRAALGEKECKETES